MNVELRLKTRDKVQKTMNHVFDAGEDRIVTLLPIPDFIKDAKCGCGKDAVFMDDNMTCFCGDCIDIGETTLKEDETLSIMVTERTVKRMVFEWSTYGDKWYTVLGRKLLVDNWNSFITQLRNHILLGTSLCFDGEYDREQKQLSIFN